MLVRAMLVRLLILTSLAVAVPAHAQSFEEDLPLERPSDPPGLPAASLSRTSAAATITFGRFTSVQVNVDATGANIVGDAANEPSIAVDPNDPSRIAIGWRQFGDYYHMISHNDGADLAWAATFNGEEDVYYLHLPLAPTGVAERTSREPQLSGAPNPVSFATTLRFQAPGSGAHVALGVFDAAGRRVTRLLDGVMSSGPHSVRWSGTDAQGHRVSPGLYLARLETPLGTTSFQLMVLR